MLPDPPLFFESTFDYPIRFVDPSSWLFHRRGIPSPHNVQRPHLEIPPHVEGTARRQPETPAVDPPAVDPPAADPPVELDTVVTSPQYFEPNLLIRILSCCPLAEVFKARLLCKSLRDYLSFSSFLDTRARIYPVESNSLAPLVFYEQDGELFLMGYDSSVTNTWIRTPPLPCFFSGNTKSVAGHLGLLCVFVKEPNGAGMHFAFNPLTQKERKLSPMRFPRSPCVTNLHVTVDEKRYQVIAVGSQTSGTHSRKTEVYDSKSNQWTEAAELPQGYLIDNQSGVRLEGRLYVTGSRELYSPKEVMVLNVKNRNWLDPIALPHAPPMTMLPTVQLLQCNGKIYLFSQDVIASEITHCIYRFNPGSEGEYRWIKKVNDKFKKKETFSRTEYTCVPVKGKQGTKLGIFKASCSVSAVNESVCRVYDITEDDFKIETAASQFLPCPPFASENAVLFHPENPVGYSFAPSFSVDA